MFLTSNYCLQQKTSSINNTAFSSEISDGLRVNHFSANSHLRVYYLSNGRANGFALCNKLGLCNLRKVRWHISGIYQMAFISYLVLDVECVYAAALFSQFFDLDCWYSRWTVYNTVIKPFMKMVNMIFHPCSCFWSATCQLFLSQHILCLWQITFMNIQC